MAGSSGAGYEGRVTLTSPRTTTKTLAPEGEEPAEEAVEATEITEVEAAQAGAGVDEGVGLEAVFDQPDLLGADLFLNCIRNEEARRGRPDVSDRAMREVAPLMQVAAGDQAKIAPADDVQQVAARGHRDVADRRVLEFGVVGRVEEQRSGGTSG